MLTRFTQALRETAQSALQFAVLVARGLLCVRGPVDLRELPGTGKQHLRLVWMLPAPLDDVPRRGDGGCPRRTIGEGLQKTFLEPDHGTQPNGCQQRGLIGKPVIHRATGSTRCPGDGCHCQRTRLLGRDQGHGGTMPVRNLHIRCLPDAPGALIDTLAGDTDRLWPHDAWPALRFDRPLGVGATGGHGPIRYHVIAHVPDRWVRFRFTAPRGFDGFHEFTTHEAADGSTELHHLLSMTVHGAARITWPAVWRPLHDALIEDSLDRAERHITGTVHSPTHWPWYVRLLRSIAARLTMSRSPEIVAKGPAIHLRSFTTNPTTLVQQQQAPWGLRGRPRSNGGTEANGAGEDR